VAAAGLFIVAVAALGFGIGHIIYTRSISNG
jgi:hypothetical protein